MTDPVVDGNPDGAQNEKTKFDVNDSTAVDLDLDESKAHLINANGGAGGDHPDDYKVAIADPTPASSDGEVSFHGLGKEEVMRYANDPFWVRLRWILFILFWLGWLAMLVTAIAIIVLAPRCPPRPDLKWYNTETVYQVFPKSFKDSNDDGVGDFGGLQDEEDYINKDLEIKAIWLNSMFVTDGKDSGTGIIDHKDIDPTFGVTLDKFKSWLKKMRKAGKKVILDLIPNHSSKDHPWFQKSRDNDEQYKDYYVWAENTNGQPPNNWQSVYRGSAWTLDDKRKAWYLHQFSSDHPDLNLHNEAVKNEIKNIMKFWFDAGVSGFHIQGLEYLVENPDLTVDDDTEKTQTRNYNGTLTFLEELRTVANDFSDKPGRERLLFGTVRHATKNQTMEYWGPKDNKRLHIVSPLMDQVKAGCDAQCLLDLMMEMMTDDRYQWLGLQLGNQDVSRITSRLFEPNADYKKRLMVAHAVQLLMPGTPFNYYGDEFGQKDGTVPADAKKVDKQGRDNFRTPMQWSKQEYAGFSKKDPWLPVGPDYQTDNRQAGMAHFADMTPLQGFQKLIKLRRRESFQWGKTKVCAPNKDLLLFSRKATRFPYFLVAINTGTQNIHVSKEDLECVPHKEEGTVLYHTREEQVDETLNVEDYSLELRPKDVVVFEFPAED